MTTISATHNDPAIIVPYAADIKQTGIPVGYLECNGQTLDSTNPQYARLHRLINTIYGVGFDGFLCEIDTEGNLRVANEQAGPMVDAHDVDTGFAILTEKQGNVDDPQITKIIGKSACEIPAGSHFMINGKETQWYVWFQIDGNGVDPQIPEKTGIRIVLASTDSEKMVSETLAYQLSTVRFKVPDLRGMFVRGGPVDPNNSRDPDFASRAGGNRVGSVQWHMYASHQHHIPNPEGVVGATSPTEVNGFPGQPRGQALRPIPSITAHNGGAETRPINMYLTYLIKY